MQRQLEESNHSHDSEAQLRNDRDLHHRDAEINKLTGKRGSCQQQVNNNSLIIIFWH